MLSLLIFLPIIVAVLILLLPKLEDRTSLLVGLGTAAVSLVLSGMVFAQTKIASFHFSLLERSDWVKSLGISYHVGVDGLAVWLLLLTGIVGIAVFGFALNTKMGQGRTLAICVLTLLTALYGSFLSLDLILFFTFFELTLIPMWVMINTWGGENRKRASFKFLAYTFAGSIFMLIGMVTLAMLGAQKGGVLTFDLIHLQAMISTGEFWKGAPVAQTTIFWAFMVGFLVKTPVFPFHTWIADTYAESPVVGPMLSSVMVKLGSFGMLRFMLPLFPEAVQGAASFMMVLATLSIVLGAVVAAVQTDARRMLAYSTLSHMGFVVLGIFSLTHTGIVGASIQQIAHGVTATLLMMLVGVIIDRIGTSDLRQLGGIKAIAPKYATVFLLAMLASVGLPGLNGFVGEFLALMGAFQSGYSGFSGISTAFAVVSGLGVVFAAVYLLGMFQKIFYGPEKTWETGDFTDLKPAEFQLAAFLLIFVFIGGLMPSMFTKPVEAAGQAARLMAIEGGGKRPVWADRTLEIDFGGKQSDRGALVRIDSAGEPVEILSGSNLYAIPEKATNKSLAYKEDKP